MTGLAGAAWDWPGDTIYSIYNRGIGKPWCPGKTAHQSLAQQPLAAFSAAAKTLLNPNNSRLKFENCLSLLG